MFSGSGRIGDRGGWALPSTGSSNNVGGKVGGPPQHSGRTKPDVGNGTGSSRVRSNRGGSSNQTKHY